ncbi:hypothetical protein DPEC_G00315940 [Dallia pectoralis]|uniref:Uncharacterized protein n=1 Tax=Dallia pectoralis TaxID=75939 RepID=A0ACC2FCE8_DALPE|nr:hypothetical protein DPEC_G00315940 [Dallia pectoralis]
MKVMERNVIRLAVVQHLRAAYGIKIKNWNKNKAHNTSYKLTASNSGKVFGLPLESLPQCNVESSTVPCFLMDACRCLLGHVDTEGLFRKSGSIVRLKALRAKLDSGEDCLSSALPCDVAGLVKQFFRELPDPVLPTELHDAFLKAQQLSTEEERTSVTLLLSCVLPDRNMNVLRYFFGFLHNVSQRSAVNKMDSRNLSVILAPNLLHAGDGTDKMNAGTEKRLKQQAAVVHCLIENSSVFGVAPLFITEKIPAMLGCEDAFSPTVEGLGEFDTNSGAKRRCRRSLGDVVSGALHKLKSNRTPTNTSLSDRCVFSSATPVIVTPSSKRKPPLESGQSYGFSSKKRRSIIKNLGLDLMPNALFGGSLTPRPGHVYPSASESLDASQDALGSVGRCSRQPGSSARRRSRRLIHRNVVSRVESGKAGCFSPKATKKEHIRKSLRLRFSLGKNTRDPREGSESVGWRLATQESTASFPLTKDAEFSPAVLANKSTSKGSTFYNKSEDNLLSPRCDNVALQTSWNGRTPDEGRVSIGGSFTDTPIHRCLNNNNTYYSEPVIVVAKPPIVASFPKKPISASSAASLETEASISQTLPLPTLLKVKKAFPVKESGGDLQKILGDHSVPSDGKSSQPDNTQTDSAVLEYSHLTGASPNRGLCGMPTHQRLSADENNVTFGQIEFVPLSPLHIDSALFDAGFGGLSGRRSVCSPCPDEKFLDDHVHTGAVQMNCSSLIDALDIQSPAHFTRSVAVGLQSTPYRASGAVCWEEPTTASPSVSVMAPVEGVSSPGLRAPQQGQEAPSPGTLGTTVVRVADHIQRFNKLTLYSPKSQAKAVRSPLKFQRTPVRQSVRRINSMLGDRRPAQARNCSGQVHGTNTPAGKAVSLESGLSAGTQLQPCQSQADYQGGPSRGKGCPPPVPPKKRSCAFLKPSTCPLGDLTNKVQVKALGRTPVEDNLGGGMSVVQRACEEDLCRSSCSRRNTIIESRLLSATKPIDH